MQIRKIKVELVMLIIEQASLCMTTMNYQHATAGSLETHEYIFQTIEHVFDKTSIFQFKKIKNGFIQLCSSKSAIHVLQVMIN